MPQAESIRALLLAAGKGTRLAPLTDHWPKCLMPIGDRPLLEYWLHTLQQAGVHEVLVNRHHHAEQVDAYLNSLTVDLAIRSVYEPQLLNTAGTIRANADYFQGHTSLIIHADNWCQCDFADFIDFHRTRRAAGCLISMMTFTTDNPKSCGIVELDEQGIVRAFHEKVEAPPGDRANAAVYIVEPPVIDWIVQRPAITDFSLHVLPAFIGRIATWHNAGIHRDIGTAISLDKARHDPRPQFPHLASTRWQQDFRQHDIHRSLDHSSSQQVTG